MGILFYFGTMLAAIGASILLLPVVGVIIFCLFEIFKGDDGL